jgi:hypothetical protein
MSSEANDWRACGVDRSGLAEKMAAASSVEGQRNMIPIECCIKSFYVENMYYEGRNNVSFILVFRARQVPPCTTFL